MVEFGGDVQFVYDCVCFDWIQYQLEKCVFVFGGKLCIYVFCLCQQFFLVGDYLFGFVVVDQVERFFGKGFGFDLGIVFCVCCYEICDFVGVFSVEFLGCLQCVEFVQLFVWLVFWILGVGEKKFYWKFYGFEIVDVYDL